MKTTGQLEATGALSKRLAIHRFEKVYSGQSEEEYEAFLKASNLAEIQSHAVDVGVAPGKDRGQLERSLRGKFKKTLKEYNT